MINTLSIKDLENISGIKAHTIRTWEKRYSIFDPKRTPTNIRYYDHDDLKKLLNLVSVLDHGMKISKASALSAEDLNSKIEELQKQNIDTAKASLINDLIVATLKCDNKLFESVYQKSIDEFGTEETIETVISPLLIKIGLMWTINKLNPSHEHFTSQLVRQKLFSAINSLPFVQSDNRFVLFLPETEFHEIGLLYSYYILRKENCECIYLGANVPIVDVEECSINTNAKNIICAFTIFRSKKRIDAYLDNMIKMFKDYKILVHGLPDSFKTTYQHSNIYFISTIDDLKNHC
jgi:DNA-binding transcriptional MerR regulator